MQSLKGIIPPVVTPLKDEDTLDVEGLEKLIEHLVSGGVHGLFILGTTGEGPSLGYNLRYELIQRVCNQVKRRVPVLVGISDTSFTESIRMSEKSSEYGADAVVIAPPYYFNIDRAELHNYMYRLIKEVPIPLILYNYPALTKLSFNPEMVDDLVQQSKVIGFKDSSADVIYFHKLNRVSNRSRFSLLMGPEELLMETLLMGGDGGVSGGANIFPQWYVSLYEAVEEGNIDQALTLHNKIMKLSSVVYSGSGNSSGNVIAGLKKALSYLDVCNDYVATPFNSVTEEKAKKIRNFLTDVNSEKFE